MMYTLLFIISLLISYLLMVSPPFRDRGIYGLYSHRGFHNKERMLSENTLESFQESIDKNLGIELDVQLSKDGVVYVYHDKNLQRLIGRDVDFIDLTSDELDKINLHGSKIPRFEDVLQQINGQVEILVELKNSRRYRELCKKVSSYLDEYKGYFVVQSFDPRIILWFRRYRKDYTRGQLITIKRNYNNFLYANLMHSMVLNLITRPDFIALNKNSLPLNFAMKTYQVLGGSIAVWTVQEKDILKGDVDAIIFEGSIPKFKIKT